MAGKLKLVGLTGGIGTGKSTVARLIRESGVPVLDADVFAREVVRPGQAAHAEIAALWPDAIAADGTIDRRVLGAKVFSDPEARRRLEAITHPRIGARALEGAALLAAAGHELAFYEAALLVEAARHRDFDALVVVTATEEQQIGRVQARDGLTRDAALARVRAQLPMSDKVKVATHVIDNSADLAETRAQVRAMLSSLSAAFSPPGSPG